MEDLKGVSRTIEPFGGVGGLFTEDQKKKKHPAGRLGRKGDKLLDAYEYLMPRTVELVGNAAESFGDLYRSETAKTRADELAGFKQYGPEYLAAIEAADPLRARSRQIVLDNLGEGLDPAISREIEQGTRGAYAARGLAAAPASAVAELFNLGSAGKALENDNLMMALRLSQATDPFLAYAGRPSGPQGSNIMAPNYADFNNDLFTYDVNSEIMRNNNAQASKNRTASYINAGISALGNIGGAATKFI